MFLVLPSFVLGADINLALPVNGGDVTCSAGGTQSGLNNINNGNLGDYFEIKVGWQYNKHTIVTVTCILSLAENSEVSEINWAGIFTHQFGSTPPHTATTSVLDGGTWKSLSTAIAPTITTGWDDVSQIKVVFYINNPASASNDMDALYSYWRLNELEAWGPEPILYEDIGLKVYDGIGPVSIAVYPLGTLDSNLRIRASDGNTYAVVLVPISDTMSSNVKIQTSSGVMALRKLN